MGRVDHWRRWRIGLLAAFHRLWALVARSRGAGAFFRFLQHFPRMATLGALVGRAFHFQCSSARREWKCVGFVGSCLADARDTSDHRFADAVAVVSRNLRAPAQPAT